MAAHDLLIQVMSWSATLEVGSDPAESLLVLDVDPEAALREIGADLERRAPARDLDEQVVRGHGRGTPPSGLDPEGAVLRPEGVRASRDLHAEL